MVAEVSDCSGKTAALFQSSPLDDRITNERSLALMLKRSAGAVLQRRIVGRLTLLTELRIGGWDATG